MKIYTEKGLLAFKTFSFPDYSPHFELLTSREPDCRKVTIEVGITSLAALFNLQMAAQVLRQQGYTEINLDIRYLMGARMDRAISPTQPYTLQLIAQQLNSCGFRQVRVLDCHSDIGLRLLGAMNVMPLALVTELLRELEYPVVVVPDKGAVDRVEKLIPYDYPGKVIHCEKHRNPDTGQLTEFAVSAPEWAERVLNEGNGHCIILDDICDGGRTFTGVSNQLTTHGAKRVDLFVTHGIFSAGLPIACIDHVYTTNSYKDQSKYVTSYPIDMAQL